MKQSAQNQTLTAAIREGIESGVSDKTVPEIMEDVETRLRATSRLSANTQVGQRPEREKNVDSKD